MQNITNAVLDRIARRRGLRSDYALAKAFGSRPSRIYNYRSGVSSMDSSVAVQAAKLAELDPAVLMAELEAERATVPEVREQWMRLAELARRESDRAAP